MKKFKIEFYRLKINGIDKTIAIRRIVCDFDNIEMNKWKSTALWKDYMDNIIKNIFNLDEWIYLGDEEHYDVKQNENIILVEYINEII